MNFEHAREVVVNLLRQHGRARTSELLAAVGGDDALWWQRVRKDLIFNDLAKDMNRVGLAIDKMTQLDRRSRQSFSCQKISALAATCPR
jgi:hypothetical protein